MSSGGAPKPLSGTPREINIGSGRRTRAVRGASRVAAFSWMVSISCRMFERGCFQLRQLHDEVVRNLEDAVVLYLKDDLPRQPSAFRQIGTALLGEISINA